MHAFLNPLLEWLQRLLIKVTTPRSTVTLLSLAVFLAIVTFVALAGGMSLSRYPQAEALLFLFDCIMLALLTLLLARHVGRVLIQRRLGHAGARLHIKLMLLFGVVASVPTMLLGILAALFFHFGVEIWFSTRITNALVEAQSVAVGYLREHNENARADAFGIANALLTAENDAIFVPGSDFFHDNKRLESFLGEEVTARGLNSAVLFDPFTRRILASAGLFWRDKRATEEAAELPSKSLVAMAQAGGAVVHDQPDLQEVEALVRVGNTGLMLMVKRPVSHEISSHVQHMAEIIRNYQRLLANRAESQIAFVSIFALLVFLILAIGTLIGLSLATGIVRPLGLLIRASQRVSLGDLAARVPIKKSDASRGDEVTILSRAFNRMTDQLASQRNELVKAYNTLNERTRFTEAVLSGVSAGVIGLDKNQSVELFNRMAEEILGRSLERCKERKLVECLPELKDLLDEAKAHPARSHTAEIQIDSENLPAPGGPGAGAGAGAGRTLFVRIVAEREALAPDHSAYEGYVVTFDDITDLQAAQRKAAWSDVARRVAHEIKNPLTPIQLAAERLRRRFLKEIQSSPETYSELVDTIIRQVGDIGKMVDDFSAFARMPDPFMERYNLATLCQEALVLQRAAHSEIKYETKGLGGESLWVLCDRRLIAQALTNLLQNAADAIEMRFEEEEKKTQQQIGAEEMMENENFGRKKEKFPPKKNIGRIALSLWQEEGYAVIGLEDDGIGLPAKDKLHLLEPYVTFKPKGTGLGLAIVKRIIDVHHGKLDLTDVKTGLRVEERGIDAKKHTGAFVSLFIPLVENNVQPEFKSIEHKQGMQGVA
ncbi:HAMP domain-containing protein [Acetobacteraceae bacterium]|nr:HAMP domain-containing protein [Acetobacteraceae bacterium]